MTQPATTDSLGRRYLFKLLSNVATIPLYFVMEAVLPRALGPAMYGNYNFATTLFQNFTTFLDMGTSTCLHTSLSKRPGEFGLVSFYARVAVVMFVLCFLAALAMHIPGAAPRLMPDVPVWMALPAALWAYLTWGGRVMRGVGDDLAVTAHSERIRIGVNMTSALVLLGLFFWGVLSLPVLFLHQYVFLSLLGLGIALTLRGSWAESGWSLSPRQLRDYVREFRKYSTPLFTIALCTVISLSGERWMLQFFDGSVQQGYFSLSQKVGMACFMFVTAMTPLLMRELAVAHGRNDPVEMARLMDRFAPMLYAVAAWFSCFTVIEAEAVIRIFGGERFTDALLPVQIMAMYPVHQAYGQVTNSVYYAAGETRALRNITLWSLLGGLGAAWVLLAPAAYGGLSLGATGLACKMVGVQFVAVNILLFACRKVVPFNLKRNLVHQLVCPAIFLALALCARTGTEAAGLGDGASLPRFFLSGVCYSAITLGVVLVFPFTVGLKRGEIGAQLRRLRGSRR